MSATSKTSDSSGPLSTRAEDVGLTLMRVPPATSVRLAPGPSAVLASSTTVSLSAPGKTTVRVWDWGW